ncbi:dihydrodipicolinate synthase family protein [Candidatus Uhrbacteria bacterium]|nr:dihydrodipicolinate synthase family protein [Candidatus Uhrbacteria bacterium]
MKENSKMNGLFVPLITPFYQGDFDVASMKKLVGILQNSVDGVIPCLSSGEGGKLSDLEWQKIVETVCKTTTKPVFAGILRDTEQKCLALIKKSNWLPCEGIVIPTLYDYEEKNLKFVKRACNLSKKSIIVYNTEKHPFRSVEVIMKIDKFPNIVAVKDSSMDMIFLKKLLTLKRRGKLRLSIFQGMEHLLLPSQGCDGYILSLLNTESKLCATVFKKTNTQNNKKMHKVFWEQNLGGNWYTTLKGILYERGIIRSAEEIRPPIKP